MNTDRDSQEMERFSGTQSGCGSSRPLLQAKEGFHRVRENRTELFSLVGVWEVGREIIIDWAWREAVEIASYRPMRARQRDDN